MEQSVKEKTQRCLSLRRRTRVSRLQKRRRYLIAKRCMDVAGAVIFLLLLWPVMLLIALLIRLDSLGPVIYRQERLGLYGRPFIMYKFRTMCPDAEPDGPCWASVTDCRCTRAGRFLRRTHLDELPQLWNVLRGEMSLVGPRPERKFFYLQFQQQIPEFPRRLSVKPGLTGLAQINGGYDLSPEEKIRYDMEYIHEQSLVLDLFCLIKTVRLLFTQEGAR